MLINIVETKDIRLKRERHYIKEEKKTSVNWFGNFHNWVTKICRPLVKFYSHGG